MNSTLLIQGRLCGWSGGYPLGPTILRARVLGVELLAQSCRRDRSCPNLRSYCSVSPLQWIGRPPRRTCQDVHPVPSQGEASARKRENPELCSLSRMPRRCLRTRVGQCRRFCRPQAEVVLLFRPECSPVKVDQGFTSGCHFHGFRFAGMDLVGGQDAMGRVGPIGVVIGEPLADTVSGL